VELLTPSCPEAVVDGGGPDTGAKSSAEVAR
jgi:hypothetical protein